ncbi:hypothetical protein [Halobacillus mangrovi]|uniref:Uncharacterized protein n=1 Tax=Halobacillus mangrovi TaxID=402384 RepID=A0A1W5ZX37_9BACI|nr:hypothetical protein [Halobacillus mangrovi]ARI77811.1 hypothetical protein HM131_13555 [Halobacillus mangrovi]
MKQLVILIVSILLVVVGCESTATEKNSNQGSAIDQKIRENVWSYVERSEIALREKEAWLTGEIEEKVIDEEIASHQNLDGDYLNETVLKVTPGDSEKRDAYPTILVDPDTQEVIAVLAGY